MNEHPIRFNDEMVRAVLAGRKTQTRRIVTQKNSECGSAPFGVLDLANIFASTTLSGAPCLKAPRHEYEYEEETIHRIYPRWDVGDRLWIRETWKPTKSQLLGPETYVRYRADDSRRSVSHSIEGSYQDRWRSSSHMPRWASRINLTVTGVRVERVQDISDEDAMAEGIMWNYDRWDVGGLIEQFSDLWNSIYARRGYGWDTNPWVWVIEFEHVANQLILMGKPIPPHFATSAVCAPMNVCTTCGLGRPFGEN